MDTLTISPVKKFKDEYVGVCGLWMGGFGSVHLVEDKEGIKRARKLMLISDVRFKVMSRREAEILLE